MNSLESNTAYSSTYARMAYTQTRAIRPDTHEERTGKQGQCVRIRTNEVHAYTVYSSASERIAHKHTGLFVRIRTNSVHANTGYLSGYASMAYTQTRAIRSHTH